MDVGLLVTLRQSKTDQEGAHVTKGLPIGTQPETCPKHVLQTWLDTAAITSGPLFRPIDRWGNVSDKALSDLGVARAVKRGLITLGLDPAAYSGHSLRAGLVTAAAIAGVSERIIMQQTGHKNVTVLRRSLQEGSLFRETAAVVGL